MNEIDFAKLTESFPHSDWQWRIQQAKWNGGKPWALVIPYIDARDIQNRLDKVVGPERWQVSYRHENGGVMCSLLIHTKDGWVSKMDGSDPTDSEPFKGSISKALVRAASAWGIGRHLYEESPQFAQIVSKDTHGARYAKADEQTFYWLPPGLPQSPPSQQNRSLQAEKELTHDAKQESNTTPSSSGGYVIPFGKFKGKRLEDVKESDLENYAGFLEDCAAKEGKPLMGKALEFVKEVQSYLDVPF